jgi:hypothetical protein
MKAILYNTGDKLNIIGVNDASIDYVTMIAEKDVPSGFLFRICDDSELPTDKTYRNAWVCEINESNADGIGLTQEQFIAKYPDLKHYEVKEST